MRVIFVAQLNDLFTNFVGQIITIQDQSPKRAGFIPQCTKYAPEVSAAVRVPGVLLSEALRGSSPLSSIFLIPLPQFEVRLKSGFFLRLRLNSAVFDSSATLAGKRPKGIWTQSDKQCAGVFY